MKSKEEYIVGYVKFLGSQFRKQRDNPNALESDIQKYSHWLSLIENLETKFQWQVLPPEEKQNQRVAWLRSLQKRGLDIEKQLLTLKLHDAITSSLPFMRAFDDRIQVRRMIEVCQAELLVIDYSGRGFGSSHISPEEYENAFEVDLGVLNLPSYTSEKIEVISSLFKTVLAI
ncbi:MAG: hypothetical protein AAF544_04255 [Bacteroidota bacterium]